MRKSLLKKTTKLLFGIFIFTFIGVPINAKTIIVLLDNSASMKYKGDAQMSQCDGAIFALQVMISTLESDDDLYLVLAYKPGDSVHVEKNPSIEYVQHINCRDTYVYKSLYKAIELSESLDPDSKKLVILGDGEWFAEGDPLTNEISQDIRDRLEKISLYTDISYINTSEISNKKNEFKKRIITVLNKKRAIVDLLQTNQDPVELMNKIDETTNNFLNVPPDNNKNYQVSGKSLKLFIKLPLRSIFLLIQSNNGNLDMDIENIESKTGQLFIIKKDEKIERGELFGAFYEIIVENNLIKPSDITVFFKNNITQTHNISVYYRAGLKSEPPIPSSPLSVLRFSNGTYEVCDSLSKFHFKYPLRDIMGNTLPNNILSNTKVSLLDKDKQLIKELNLDTKKQFFTGFINVEQIMKTGNFFIKVKVYDAFEDIYKIQIVKVKCNEMMISSRNFDFFHHLSNDTSFRKTIPLPDIKDKNTKEYFDEEKPHITFKIEGDTSQYKIIRSNGRLFLYYVKKDSNFICECLRIASKQHLKIFFSHRNVNNRGVYIINVLQQDSPWWERCWKLLLLVFLLLLSILYIIKVKRKPRFYGKRGKRAAVEKYENPDEYTAYSNENKPLNTGFFKKYILPYGKENLKYDGLHFIADKGESINVTMKSIKNVKEEYDFVYLRRKNNSGRKRIGDLNTEVIHLRQGDALEFENSGHKSKKNLIRYKYIIANQ